MDEKRCTACHKTLPTSQFHKWSRGKDGLQSRCKSCHSEMQRRYYHERGGKQKALARMASTVVVEDGTKTCKDCGETKHVSEFYRHKVSPDGRGYSCKVCMTARNMKWKAENPERLKAAMSVASRRHHLNKNYGLTPEAYDDLVAAQGGVCAICGQAETWTVKGGGTARLSVDHDHACCPGKKSCGECIRGLLCRRCNHTLGQVNEDPEVLMAMVRYLVVFKDSSE